MPACCEHPPKKCRYIRYRGYPWLVPRVHQNDQMSYALEAIMDDSISEYIELKQLREHIHQSVNSLELCGHCERICECEQWIVDGLAPVWLCIECLMEVRGAGAIGSSSTRKG